MINLDAAVSYFDLTAGVLGLIGSFLREAASLHRRLAANRKIRMRDLSFIPIWVLCGALLSASLGPYVHGQMILALFAGALWRPIIGNSHMMSRIISLTISEMSRMQAVSKDDLV